MRIAISINDPGQSSLISQALSADHHACITCTSSAELVERLGAENISMLIMESVPSGRDGIAFLHAVRKTVPASFPILLIAERAAEDAIAAALDAGASDYLIKPLRRGELQTRVRILLRRAYPEQHTAQRIQFGRYTFEIQAECVLIDGTPVDVTQKEFELALLFFRHLGRPLSRAYILETIWTHEADMPSRTMDTHVSRVRNKLGLLPQNGFRLTSVYGYGYRLEQLSE